MKRFTALLIAAVTLTACEPPSFLPDLPEAGGSSSSRPATPGSFKAERCPTHGCKPGPVGDLSNG